MYCVIIGLLIFLPAGTINYWNGWLLIGILFIPMFIAGIVMMINSPELLKKRLNIKESNIMAIGDSPNDSAMIIAAGLGIAMGNALEEVKAIADYVTLSNSEDGVAHAVRKFVLDAE